MHSASVGFQCPECVAEGRRTLRAPRTVFGGTLAGQAGYVTKTLIGINVAVFVIGLLAGGIAALGRGGLGGGATPLHLWGSVLGRAAISEGGQIIGIATGEYWRLFTAMFLHFGVLHLLVNMWALWILGRHLERMLGPARFIALYLLGGLGGSVAAYLFSAPNQLTAGASGAIFGMFAALFVVNRKLGLDNSGVIGLILINLALGLFIPNISMAGHLGGLVTGGVVALGLAYAPRHARTPVQVATGAVVAVLLVILVMLRTGMLVG